MLDFSKLAQYADVIASLVTVLVAGLVAGLVVALCGCDKFEVQLLSRQPDLVATSSLCNCCRDSLILSLRLLCTNVVATT